jgi:hypothetical protein
MFWRHEIRVTPGFEAIVNGRIVDRRPLRVGACDNDNRSPFRPAQQGCRPCWKPELGASA